MLPAGVRRRRFGVEKYHRMREVGIFSEDDWIEFLEGEVTEEASRPPTLEATDG